MPCWLLLAGGRAAQRPSVRRVLLMRLERIGDSSMVRDAIDDAHTAWPNATIDLAVGAGTRPLPRCFRM